jgi:hypothetical protein
VQTVTIGATGGTFNLEFNGQTTVTPLSAPASAAAVTTALESLSSIASGSVTVTLDTSVTDTSTYTITFTGADVDGDVAELTVPSDGALVGGTQSSTVATTMTGVPASSAVTTTTPGTAVSTSVVMSREGRLAAVDVGFPGWFKLSMNSGGVQYNTSYLAHNATALEVEEALESLPSLDNCTVVRGDHWANVTTHVLPTTGYPHQVWTYSWAVTLVTIVEDTELLSIEWFPSLTLDGIKMTLESNALGVNTELHPMVPVILDPSLASTVGDAAVVTEVTQGCTEARCFDAVTGSSIGLQETASRGIVQFRNLRINFVGIGYTIKFTAASGVTVTSPRFNVVSSDPVGIKLVTPAGSAWAGGEPFLVQPSCSIVDAGGNVILSDSVSLVSATLVTSPLGSPLLGQRDVVLKAGIAMFEDLSVAAAAPGYVLRFSTPLVAVYVEQTLTVAASAETLLIHANRVAGDNMGAAVAVHNSTAVSGAPWKAQTVAEVQIVSVSGEHTMDVVGEVQTITLYTPTPLAEIQKISTSTNTSLYVPGGDNRRSEWSITWRNATTRYLSFDISALTLKEFVEIDLAPAGVGSVSVTRATAAPGGTRGHAAFDWHVTFTSLSITAPANCTQMVVTNDHLAGNNSRVEVVTEKEATQIGGTWRISLADPSPHHIGVTTNGNSTPPLAFDIDAPTLEAYIALSFYGDDEATGYGRAPSVSVGPISPQGGRTYTLAWNGSLTHFDPATFDVDGSALTGDGATLRQHTLRAGRAPVRGNFTAFVRGAGPSSPIAWDATAEEVRVALSALDSVETLAVTRARDSVTGDELHSEWLVTFHALKHNTTYGWVVDTPNERQRNVVPMTFNPEWLTGTGAAVSVRAAFSGNEASLLMPWEDQRIGSSGTRAGAAFIFESAANATTGVTSWAETAELRPHDASEYDEFGTAVGVYADLAVVGAPYSERHGSAEIQGIQCTADGGAFKLGFHGMFTEKLLHNITYNELERALLALPSITRILVKPYTGGLCQAPAPGKALTNANGLNSSAPIRRVAFPTPHAGDAISMLVRVSPFSARLRCAVVGIDVLPASAHRISHRELRSRAFRSSLLPSLPPPLRSSSSLT